MVPPADVLNHYQKIIMARETAYAEIGAPCTFER